MSSTFFFSLLPLSLKPRRLSRFHLSAKPTGRTAGVEWKALIFTRCKGESKPHHIIRQLLKFALVYVKQGAVYHKDVCAKNLLT